MKKPIIFLSAGILSLTLFSFTGPGDGVKRLAGGNYSVPEGIVSETDAKALAGLTIAQGASETVVVHTTVWKHKDALYRGAAETQIVHETVWKHKDKATLREDAKTRSEVERIMTKYLND